MSLRRIPDDQLATADASVVAAQIADAFAFVDGRGSEPLGVRVFVPPRALDGRSRAGTTVEVIAPDGPYLLATVAEEIRQRGFGIVRTLHPVLGVERNASGAVGAILPARNASGRESFLHFELDTALDDAASADLVAGLRDVLAEAQAVNADTTAMRDRVVELALSLGHLVGGPDAETPAFLHWLLDGNFVLLGLREYRRCPTGDGRPGLQAVDGLGLLGSRHPAASTAAPVAIDDLPEYLRERLASPAVLTIARTRRTSPVLQRVPMDDVTVSLPPRADGGVASRGDGDGGGRVVRLLGLFTPKADAEPAATTPVLRERLAQILELEDVVPGSHDEATLRSLFQAIPKDELFSTGLAALRRTLVELLGAEDRREVRVLFRRDDASEVVSALLALPRDHYSSALRERVQGHLLARFGGTGVEADISLGERAEAIVRFVVSRPSLSPPLAAVHDEVVALCRTWEDAVTGVLISRHGRSRSAMLGRAYVDRLPEAYRLGVDGERAADVVEALADLVARGVATGEESPATVRVLTGTDGVRIALYEMGSTRTLSQVVPVLESLGLVVDEELPFELVGPGPQLWIDEFRVFSEPDGPPIDAGIDGPRVAEAVLAGLNGGLEIDSLNRLVTRAGLTAADVAVLRGYRRYRIQAGSPYRLETVNDALVANPAIARLLMELFALRFDPDRQHPTVDATVDAPGAPGGDIDDVRRAIVAACDGVERLDHDRILRGLLALVDATVRTNHYVPDRLALAFKLDSGAVPGLPKPVPYREVFVSSPDVEGIHLRAGAVARGGLRWSDRVDDFRTEVLDLMQAQVRKNSVIVPTGAKGGFVVRNRPADGAALRDEVRRCYTIFVSSLLQITDTVRADGSGAVDHPERLVCHDGDDPYLVVAADRGTATFSDLANRLSAERGFWLGDAFASGGSLGYDHKALGITARGAWIAVRRHFLELGIDVQTEPVTVVGIGDMSGDVFGNGMLRSQAVRLVAAFDHRHVFVDPDPSDTERSFRERQRLYDLPSSSWDDYDRSLVSSGGGIWSRTLKQVPVSPEMRACLRLPAETADTVTPAELIRAILTAPVDLFFAGGIGTYVKASDEPDDEIGDRVNDELRVTADQLRARVVGEGANLSLTQRARIQYARRGGRVNADAIDNSAGVDTSDHEVNLKILLAAALAAGRLTIDQRDQLLADATADVVEAVLRDSFLQTRVLSAEVLASASGLDAYEAFVQWAAERGLVDVTVDDLPSAPGFAERRSAGAGLTRPELSVLLSAAKRGLAAALVVDDRIADDVFRPALVSYFPPQIADAFGDLVTRHRLRPELIATVVAGECVNRMGIPWAQRFAAEHGVTLADAAIAWWIAVETGGAREWWETIDELDPVRSEATSTAPSDSGVAPASAPASAPAPESGMEPAGAGLGAGLGADALGELLVGVGDLVSRLTERAVAAVAPTIVDGSPSTVRLARLVEHDKAALASLDGRMADLGTAAHRAARARTAEHLVDLGIAPTTAARFAGLRDLTSALDISAVARSLGHEPVVVADGYLVLCETLGIDVLADLLDRHAPAHHWAREARAVLAEELRLVAQDATRQAFGEAGAETAAAAVVARWVSRRADSLERVRAVVKEVADDPAGGLDALTVGVRAVRSLVD